MTKGTPADSLAEQDKQDTLRRMSRRRHRAQKTGANSGTAEKSWAEYSQYSFTPSGDHAIFFRLLWPVFGIGTIVAVTCALIYGDHYSVSWGDKSGWEYALAGYVLLTVGVLCAMMSVAAIAVGVVRIIKDSRATGK